MRQRGLLVRMSWSERGKNWRYSLLNGPADAARPSACLAAVYEGTISERDKVSRVLRGWLAEIVGVVAAVVGTI